MTADNILTAALNLLGYTAQNGNERLTRRIMQKAITIINTVYSDLHRIEKPNDPFEAIKSLKDEIKLDNRIIYEVMQYGVAAFIAQSENEGDNQALWMSVYNSKRGLLSKSDRIHDVLPRCYDL